VRPPAFAAGGHPFAGPKPAVVNSQAPLSDVQHMKMQKFAFHLLEKKPLLFRKRMKSENMRKDTLGSEPTLLPQAYEK